MPFAVKERTRMYEEENARLIAQIKDLKHLLYHRKCIDNPPAPKDPCSIELRWRQAVAFGRGIQHLFDGGKKAEAFEKWKEMGGDAQGFYYAMGVRG